MFETTCRDGIVQVQCGGARWLSTAWDGGFQHSDSVYNVTVPTDFDRTDLDTYRSQRLADADFPIGPTLLTGVDMTHARCASAGPVRVVATAGLSNPARLPVAEHSNNSYDVGQLRGSQER